MRGEMRLCPWCEDGGSPHVVSGYQEDEGRRSWVACRVCGGNGPIATSNPKAIAAWNRRSLAALRDVPEVRKLVAILGLIREAWRFDDAQQPMSSWHDREDFLGIVNAALAPFRGAAEREDQR